jgi:hypothetical protein
VGDAEQGRASGGRIALVKRVMRPDDESDGRVAALIFIGVAVAYWVALPYVDIQGNHPISDGSIYGAMAEHPGSKISVLFGATYLKDALPVPLPSACSPLGSCGRYRSGRQPDSIW